MLAIASNYWVAEKIDDRLKLIKKNLFSMLNTDYLGC